jgi:hypothetical protein
MVESVVTSLDKDGDKIIDPGEFVKGRSVINDDEIQDYLVAWAKRHQILGRGLS